MATTVTQLTSLESGDRLAREEFHRRYLEREDIKRAELVEGVVYVGSPVRVRLHGQPHSDIVSWLGTYRARHPELALVQGDNTTVILDGRNEVQPDAFLMRTVPGGPSVSADGYVEGAPQLVVEIAASSISYDLHDKKEAYRRNGVREYVAWRVLDGVIDWFRLDGCEYARIEPDSNGVIESSAFPGLRLCVSKLLGGDLAGVLAALD